MQVKLIGDPSAATLLSSIDDFVHEADGEFLAMALMSCGDGDGNIVCADSSVCPVADVINTFGSSNNKCPKVPTDCTSCAEFDIYVC